MAWPDGPSGDDRTPDPNAPRPGEDSPLAVSIPDDASELAAEIAAYRREIRAQRRRTRFDRWTLARYWRPYGIPGPVVVAAVVIVGSVGGLLLALLPNARSTEPQASEYGKATAAIGQPGGFVPDVSVWIDGATRPVRALRPGVLAIVPPNCTCAATVKHLANEAREFQFRTWVVTGIADDPQMSGLVKGVAAAPIPVYDPGGKLQRTYSPGTLGVTVVIVRADAIVSQILTNVPSDGTIRGALTLLDQSA
jgi:hypothetical protein